MPNTKEYMVKREVNKVSYYLNDKLHKEDGPAITYADGYQAWYLNGKRHREGGPAVTWPDGSEAWWVNGVKIDPPKTKKKESACTTLSNGSQEWRLEGSLHREGGPAVIWPNGKKTWYHYGKISRIDGPAVIEPNGYQAWFLNGVRHREDGPAVIHPDGDQEWWVNGVKIDPPKPQWGSCCNYGNPCR